jgi:hypothetical protein
MSNGSVVSCCYCLTPMADPTVAQAEVSLPSVSHRRLDRLEDGVDGAHFISLIATTEFFHHGLFYILQVIVLAAIGPLGTPHFAREFSVALAALFVVWAAYEMRRRLALVSVSLYTALFSVLSYYYILTLAYEKIVSAQTSWFAILCFLALLSYVDYQFVTAGLSISRISETEQAIARPEGQPTFEGYLQQLFGIPAICRWLDQRQRRISVALFFASTCAFTIFIGWVWTSLLALPLALEYSSSDVQSCFADFASEYCREPLLIWLSTPFLIILPASTIGLFAVAGLRLAARRFTRLSLEQLTSSDTRAPILFLRSFRDDQVRLRKPRSRFFRKIVSFGEPRPTLDHVLLEEGSPHGPVIAIGRPGTTPPFGAARKYATDAEWRETVSDLCRNAGAIVITVDETEGVRWELQHLMDKSYFGKTLFLLPPRLTSPTEVSRVLPAACAAWPQHLDEIDRICGIATSEQRACIGWYWHDDGRLEVLTSPYNSSLSYRLATRCFFNARALPVTRPTRTKGVAMTNGHRSDVKGPKSYLGAGIMVAIAAAALALFVRFLPYGAFLLLAIFIPLAWWGLRRTKLPPALIPTSVLSLAYCLLGVLAVPVAVATGNGLATVINVAACLGLVVWMMVTQSRPAVFGLLTYQLLLFFLMTIVVATAEDSEALANQNVVVPLGLLASGAAASIYAIASLNVSPQYLGSDGQGDSSQWRRHRNLAYFLGTAAGVALTYVLLNLPYGELLLPVLPTLLAWWVLRGTRLPPALVPPAGIVFGSAAFALLGPFLLMVLPVASMAMVVWATKTQSRAAIVTFLIMQLFISAIFLSSVAFILTLGLESSFVSSAEFAEEALIYGSLLGASIYSVVKLRATGLSRRGRT